MNKFLKVVLAMLGAVNVVFGMFMPIAVALISIKFFGFNGMWSYILLISGTISSIYRGIKVGFVR